MSTTPRSRKNRKYEEDDIEYETKPNRKNNPNRSRGYDNTRYEEDDLMVEIIQQTQSVSISQKPNTPTTTVTKEKIYEIEKSDKNTPKLSPTKTTQSTQTSNVFLDLLGSIKQFTSSSMISSFELDVLRVLLFELKYKKEWKDCLVNNGKAEEAYRCKESVQKLWHCFGTSNTMLKKVKSIFLKEWFFGSISKKEACNYLRNSEEGSFLVRYDDICLGSFFVCVKFPNNRILHLKVENTFQGVFVSNNLYEDLEDLIESNRALFRFPLSSPIFGSLREHVSVKINLFSDNIGDNNNDSFRVRNERQEREENLSKGMRISQF